MLMLTDGPHTGPLFSAEQWHLVFVSHVCADMCLKGDANCSVLSVGFWRGNGEEWFEGLHASVWLKVISTLGHSCSTKAVLGCVDRKFLTLLRSGVTQRCLMLLAVMLK